MHDHKPSPAPPPAPGTILRDAAQFLRRPVLMAPAGLRSAGAWQSLAVLAAFYLATQALVLLPLLKLWQASLALPAPDAFGKVPAGWLVPITVIAAPVIEETVFRGWLTGTRRALWLLGCLVAGLLLAMAPGLSLAVRLAGLAATLVAAIAGGWRWRGGEPLPGFARGFAAIFYLGAGVFAAIHLFNYPAISLAVVPMVLPQLWGGLLLGFTRLRLGLPASMLLHACANGALLALAAAAG